MLKRIRVLAAKTEVTVGTAISLSGSDGTVNYYDMDMQPQIEVDEREGEGAFSRRTGTPGGRKGRVTFKTDVTGDGAGGVPAWATLLLPACGWVNSAGTFSPKSEAPGSNVKTITIGSYENGLKKLLRGCVGTWTLHLPAGRLAYFEWDFMGIWDAPTDVSILTPTYESNLGIRYASSTTTIGSYTPKLEEITISAGNQIILREDPADPSGYHSALITDRKVTISANPESQLVATYDPWGDWLARTERAFSATVLNATDKLTLAAPKLQVVNVQTTDRSDNQVDQIDYQANRSAAGGNDEFTFAFAAP